MTGFYKFPQFPDKMWHYIDFERATMKSYDMVECLLSPNILSDWERCIGAGSVIRLSPEAERKLKLELL